jgi:hypothetical protein
MRREKSLSQLELSRMDPSAARPAKPLFVGSIPTGASKRHKDLRRSARKVCHILWHITRG